MIRSRKAPSSIWRALKLFLSTRIIILMFPMATPDIRRLLCVCPILVETTYDRRDGHRIFLDNNKLSTAGRKQWSKIGRSGQLSSSLRRWWWDMESYGGLLLSGRLLVWTGLCTTWYGGWQGLKESIKIFYCQLKEINGKPSWGLRFLNIKSRVPGRHLIKSEFN